MICAWQAQAHGNHKKGKIMKKSFLALSLLFACGGTIITTLAAKRVAQPTHKTTSKFRGFMNLRKVVDKKDLTKAQLEELIRTEGNIILKFYATWCNPCKAITSSINKIVTSGEFDEVTWVEADVEFYGVLAGQFGVKTVPTLIFYKDGKEIRKEKGSRTAAELTKIIQELYY